MKRVPVLFFIACLAAGCVSSSRKPAGYDLPEEDMAFAGALAHYASGLIEEDRMGWFSEEALAEFLKAAELDPESYHLFSRVALAHLYKGETDQAIAVLQRARLAAPGNPQARIDLATVYHMTGHIDGHVDKAIAAYRDALEAAPERTFLYQELAKLLFWQQKDSAALTALRTGFKHADNREALRIFSYEQARRFLAAGHFDRSLPCFQLVSDQTPPGQLAAVFFLHYGSAHERAGNRTKAQKVFEAGLRVHPDAHAILNYLAYMWAERNVNLDTALAYVTRALEKEPENGAYLDTLGWIYYQQGRAADALEQIRRADALAPDDPTILDHLGDCLAAVQDTAQAVKHWRRSFRLDPANELVAKKLRANGVDTDTIRRDIEARRQEEKKRQAPANTGARDTEQDLDLSDGELGPDQP